VSTTIEFKVHFKSGHRGRKRICAGAAAAATSSTPGGGGNVPRVSRLMALAIRFDQLVQTGKVRDYAEIARLGHVTRARVSQIMNMLTLAPDIQDALLNLPLTIRGRDPLTERHIRPLTVISEWRRQRRLFAVHRARPKR
jgi:hypothetical protein